MRMGAASTASPSAERESSADGSPTAGGGPRKAKRQRMRCRWGAAPATPHRRRVSYFLLTLKIPDPLACVAIAVWSQLDVLLVVESHPELFEALGSNWSSL